MELPFSYPLGPFPKSLVDRGSLFYLGRRYSLEIMQEGPQSGVELTDTAIRLRAQRCFTELASRRILQDQLIGWLKAQAEFWTGKAIAQYQEAFTARPAGWRVKDQRSLWGSCAPSGVIRINWRLIMAPLAVLEYVVVHELCHLEVKNHSTQFWARVASVLPDYQSQRSWLRENARILQV